MEMRVTPAIKLRREVRDCLDRLFGKSLSLPLRIVVSLTFLGLCSVVASFFYVTFIYGMTNGPDIIEALGDGKLDTSTVSSIEVVEPPRGHTPFTANEYDGLPRHARITDRAWIELLFSELKGAVKGSVHQNHPANTYHAYLKVNVEEGYYWLYCDVYKDEKSSVFRLRANSRNATNPNGASSYYLENHSALSSLLATVPATAQPATKPAGKAPVED